MNDNEAEEQKQIQVLEMSLNCIEMSEALHELMQLIVDYQDKEGSDEI